MMRVQVVVLVARNRVSLRVAEVRAWRVAGRGGWSGAWGVAIWDCSLGG